MFLRELRATPALDVFHFPTLEDFRTLEQLGDARSTPLAGQCDSARAHLSLPSCLLVVQRTFPRILEVNYNTAGTICFVPLTSSVEVTVNGVASSANRLMIVQGQAACAVVEPKPNLFAVLSLAPEISDRGWPVCHDRAHVFEAAAAGALTAFRHTVQDLLVFASNNPSRMQDRATLRRMEEALLSSLDDIVTSVHQVGEPAHFARYQRIVRRIDDYLALHPAADIYTDDLALICGVSQRTLQTAVRSVRGRNVQNYLRLRRLWSVRRVLAMGRPSTKVSDIARANGFRHMGEFAAAYRSAFGETASETLARSS